MSDRGACRMLLAAAGSLVLALACGGSAHGGDQEGAESGRSGVTTRGSGGETGGSAGEAGSANGGGAGADPSTGGEGNAGRSSSSAAGSGPAGVGGAGDTCECTGCPDTVVITVGGENGSEVRELEANGDGFELECKPSGCLWTCASRGPLPDGDYAVHFEAPGFEPLDHEFALTTVATRCNCCPTSHAASVELTADDGEELTCCGAGCQVTCSGEDCEPAFTGCLDSGSEFETCAAYCGARGTTCSTCGSLSVRQWAQPSCPEHVPAIVSGTPLGCQDSLPFDETGETPQSFSCCCTP